MSAHTEAALEIENEHLRKRVAALESQLSALESPSKRHSSDTGVDVNPFADLRVLDMSRVLAGPYCTMHLGDLGAEVIKVESVHDGDETRSWGPPFASGEYSRVWRALLSALLSRF